MNTRIAIHHYANDFSERWIEYCKNNNLEYVLVDCYKNDIIDVMKNFDLLLWSWNLSHFESLQFAREVIYALEKMGKTVFPSLQTSLLYDNKVGQKYLLEAIDAPMVPSYVFYEKKEALEWVDNTIFPVVFKLSGGAAAMNVSLCESKNQAVGLINQAFGKGFSPVNRTALFRDKLRLFKISPSKKSLLSLLKATGRLFIRTEKEKLMSRDKGYVYFQEFQPDNSYDMRITITGDKATGLKRPCRENDFRASGSLNRIYDKDQIDIRAIKIAFDISRKLGFQSMSYDFILDKNSEPIVVEMSYHFPLTAYDDCEGYWDQDLNWYAGRINPQQMIIESLLNR